MPIETDDDRAVFLDPEDFGALVNWPAGSLVFVNCMFDDTFVSLSAGDMEFSQSGSRYQILLRSSDVPADAEQGDTLTISGGALITPVSLKVLELQPDGTGMTVVRLEEP